MVTNDTIIVAVISLLSGVLVTYLGAILKFRKDLQAKYDIELRDRRICHFTKLWASLEPLAKYSPSAQITYDTIQNLSENLRKWYFNEGGLYLTEASRKTYFGLQKEFVKTLRQGIKKQVGIMLRESESKENLLKMVERDIGKSKELEDQIKGDPSNTVLASDPLIEKITTFALNSMGLQKEFLSRIRSNKLDESDIDIIKERGSNLRTSLSNDIGSRRNPEIGLSLGSAIKRRLSNLSKT